MSDNNNFEFDKIALAIILAISALIFSNNIGDLFYNPKIVMKKRGYQIEVQEGAGASEGGAAKELPEILDMKAIMAVADISKGEVIFKKCAVCHVAEKGAAHKVGPNLWGVLGEKVASHENFAYSTAMKNRGADGKSWGYEDLYRYLYAPKKYVPGTKMAFAGLKKDEERADLISFLRTKADNPMGLP